MFPFHPVGPTFVAQSGGSSSTRTRRSWPTSSIHTPIGLASRTHSRPLTNYQLLGLIPFESQCDIIERNAQQQHAKLAPLFKGEQALLAKRIAFEIESAKTCLLNPATKATYDAGLRSRERPLPVGQPMSSIAAATSQPIVPPPPICAISSKPPSVVAVDSSAKVPTNLPPPSLVVDRLGISDAQAITGVRRRKDRSQLWFTAGVAGVSALIVIVVLSIQCRPDGKETVAVPTVEPAKSPKSPSELGPATREVKPKTTVHPKPVISRPPVANHSPALPPVSARGQETESPKPPRVAKKPPKGNSKSPREGYDRVDTGNDNRVPISQSETLRWQQITLPSGAELSESMLNVPEDWKEILFPKEKQGVVDHYVHVALYDNKKVWGVFTMKNDKLDGAAATLYPSGHLQTLALYRQGPGLVASDNGTKIASGFSTLNTTSVIRTVCFAFSRMVCPG